jgi:hypothetical protein
MSTSFTFFSVQIICIHLARILVQFSQLVNS